MFEKGSKPFQEILSTADARRLPGSTFRKQGICQAKLQAHDHPLPRAFLQKDLCCVLIPASAAFHTVAEACGTAGYLAPGAQPRGSAPAPSHYSPYPYSPWRTDNTIVHSSGKGNSVHSWLPDNVRSEHKLAAARLRTTLFILDRVL